MLPLALAAIASGDLEAPPGVRETAHEVVVALDPPFVRFTVTVTLTNASGRAAEAILRLPLPRGAAPTGLEVERGETWEPAASRSPAEGRAVYADVVHPRSGATRPVAAAALLPDDREHARLQVFPIPAARAARVRVHFIAPITFAGGTYRFSYPARTGGRLATPSISLEGGAPLPGLSDLVLAGSDDSVSFHAAGARGAGVWIALDRAGEDDAPVDAVLVVDRSASMQSPERRAGTADVLRRFLADLPAGSRVGAVAFGRSVWDRIPLGEPPALFPVVDPDSRWDAPPSGSDLGAALAAAAALFPPRPSRPRALVVVTDGRLEGTANDSPIPPDLGGLPADVQVSALVVASCDSAGVLASVVARRSGAIRCDLERATPGDLDRAVRATMRPGERIAIEVGRVRAAGTMRTGEQTAVFFPVRGRLPPEAVVVRADGSRSRVPVRDVPEARALSVPAALVWVDSADAFARTTLRTGHAPVGGAPAGSGLPERARPAPRAAALAPETLHRILQRSYLPAVRGCFLRHSPRARSAVPIVLEGRVEESEASELRVHGASGDLAECLRERAQTVLYPWAVGPVRFRWPITYRPEREPDDGSGRRATRSGRREPSMP